MAEPESIDVLRDFRRQLEELKAQYPELTTPEAQERLGKELKRLFPAEPDDSLTP